MLFGFQEIIRGNSGFPQDRAQRALWHIARVIWYSCVSVALRVVPDFMTACCVAVKDKAVGFQSLDDLPVAKSGKPTHGLPYNQRVIELVGYFRKDKSRLGLDQLSGHVACDFDGLCDGPALSHQPLYII
jgi:hypothetical protein